MTEKRVDHVTREAINALHHELDRLSALVHQIQHDVIGNGQPGLAQLRRELYGDMTRGMTGIREELKSIENNQLMLKTQLQTLEASLEERIVRVVGQRIDAAVRLIKWLIGIYIILQLGLNIPEIIEIVKLLPN